jgi:hypothetical protein
MMSVSLWKSRVPLEVDSLDGFEVEGFTESIGKVQDSKLTGDRQYLIVKTHFGATGFLKRETECVPIGLVDRVDVARKTLHIPHTTDQVANGPELLGDEAPSDEYLNEVERYWQQYLTAIPRSEAAPQ